MAAVVAAGFAIFCTVGATALACSLSFRLRDRIAIIVPIVLGLAALFATIILWCGGASSGKVETWQAWAFVGQVALETGWFWLALPTTLALVGLAWVAFRIEGALATRRPKLNLELALPAELIAANVPGRAEAMDAVANTARQPMRYWLITLWTVLTEEAFYRVAAPATLIVSGLPIWVALIVPAVMYAANHVGFGLVSVLGKFLLGVVLALGAFIAGAVVAIAAHLLYQYWVRRQFTPRFRGETRVSGATAP